MAVFYSQEEAQRFGEGYVSTEHLLLGLLRAECTATKTLEMLNVDAQEVRKRVEKELPAAESRPNTDMSLTPRSKRVIDLAYDEARIFGHSYIGTEHLVLGIIREADGLAGRVLARMGVSIDLARKAVIAVIESANESEPAWRPYDPPKPATPKTALRLSYTNPLLSREASFVNMLVGLGSLRFTEELLLALCLSDPAVRFALMKQSIDADTVRAVMQAVLADPDQNRIQDPRSLSFILDLADKERSNLGDEELGAIHIVIAIMALDSSLAALALSEANVSLDALRERKPPET